MQGCVRIKGVSRLGVDVFDTGLWLFFWNTFFAHAFIGFFDLVGVLVARASACRLFNLVIFRIKALCFEIDCFL